MGTLAIALSLGTRRPAILARSGLILRRTLGLVTLARWFIAGSAVAGRSRLAAHPLGETPALLVARDVEPRAWILVVAAGPPVAPAAFAAMLLRSSRFVWARPQTSAREPHHHRIGMLVLQLLEGRLELLAVLRAKGGRLSFDDDRPVGEAWRHNSFESPITRSPGWARGA
jgi:hypothetical protein